MLSGIDVSATEEKNNIEKLKKYYDKAFNIVKEVIGEEEVKSLMCDKDVLLDISYENEGWAGLCRDQELYFEIMVRYDVIYYCEPKEIVEILIHEIIHTFYNTCGHDKIWFYYADMITNETPYNIPVGGWFDEE